MTVVAPTHRLAAADARVLRFGPPPVRLVRRPEPPSAHRFTTPKVTELARRGDCSTADGTW